MPNVADFKDKNEWMDACMHVLVRQEGKEQKQAVAICLNQWRDKGKKKKKSKKCASEILRKIARELSPNE